MPQSTLTTDQREALLGSVITSQEAAARYGLAASTIVTTIRLGYIPARHSGRVWLLLVTDCDRRWGHRLEEDSADV